MKRYISEIINNEYKSWNGNIGIFSSTGTGKSSFVLEQLLTYAVENNKKILYLTNRTELREQLKSQIDKTSNIKIINYQELEYKILRNSNIMDEYFQRYNYIILDECAYFFSDAWNCRTDLIFSQIIKDAKTTKIYISATPYIVKKYLDNHNIKFDYEYTLKTNYDYITSITAYNNNESLNNIIDNIPSTDKILIFTTAKRALEIAKKYHGSFICSSYNTDYNKYRNEQEMQEIIHNKRFNNRILCSTSVLDNGISICDKAIKNIIINELDYITFIQMIGRIRIQPKQKINLYFRNFNNSRIRGFRKKIVDTLSDAKYLIDFGQEAYIANKEFKRNINNQIIDRIPVIGTDKVIYKNNDCLYFKYVIDKFIYDSILDKNSNISFKSIVATQLSIDITDIIDYEKVNKKMNLEEYLDSIVGERLYKGDRKELIEKVNLKKDSKLQKSISLLNKYLEVSHLPYIILSKRIKKDKKLYTIWTVEKLVINE